MDDQAEIIKLRASLQQAEQVQQELDRRVFNLKTLYDVSKDIFSSVESETILRNFLLMTMGNFGVMEGFVLLQNRQSPDTPHFVVFGFPDEDQAFLAASGLKLLDPETNPADGDPALPDEVKFNMPFTVGGDVAGLMGLGAKLIGEPYSENDHELIHTLVNNLIVSLKNARSFEQIKQLNQDLALKNEALEKALKELRAALRKVELLESIKSNLTKFVPDAVCRLVETSPTGDTLDAREKDISVLFLDIEGYTKITEKVGATEVNALTERYFSVFMDAIFENNGDVVETAGDGLMVLFISEGKGQHAREAVQAARTIMHKTHQVNQECGSESEPVAINIGICSGQAFVGASKFDSLTGSRWTYTAHGNIVNIAARLCSQAKGGAVLVSGATVDSSDSDVSFNSLGYFSLKNLSEQVEAFVLEEWCGSLQV